MKTVNIKGKDYVEVNERVLFFRKNFKDYKIKTELISNEKNNENIHTCVFKAEILNDKNEIISTGFAYEKENSTFINKTSYIENCETSAVGRALGFLGIGIDTSIASAEEVSNAINNQEKIEEQKEKETRIKKATQKQFDIVMEAIKEGVMKIEQVQKTIKEFEKEKFKDLTYEQAESIVSVAKERISTLGEQ